MLGFLITNLAGTGATATDHIEPVVSSDWYGSDLAGLKPEDMAAIDGPLIAAKPAGRRCLYMVGLLDDRLIALSDLCGGALSIEGWWTRGGAFDVRYDYMVRYCAAYRNGGWPLPDFMVSDHERDINLATKRFNSLGANNTARAAALGKVLNDARLKKRLPASLQKFTSADFTGGTGSAGSDKSNAMIDYDNYDQSIMLAAAREIAFGPWQLVFGHAPATIFNFDDEITRYKYFDPDLFQYNPGSRSVGGTSSPNMYSSGQVGAKPIFSGKTKEVLYNSAIQHHNRLRCMRNVSTGHRIIPWNPNPNYNGESGGTIHYTTSRTWWKRSIDLQASMGIDTTILFFGYDLTDGSVVANTAARVANAETVLAAVPQAQTIPTTGLPQIAYDAASVSVGSFSVPYVQAEWQ